MLLEVLRAAMACECKERQDFARLSSNLSALAELLWLLPQCGEFVTQVLRRCCPARDISHLPFLARLKADLADLDPNDDDDDGVHQDTSFHWSQAGSVTAETSRLSMVSLMSQQDHEEQKKLAKAEERAVVDAELSGRDRGNLLYIDDLCSELLCGVVRLVDQVEPITNTRLSRRLLNKMMAHAQAPPPAAAGPFAHLVHALSAGVRLHSGCGCRSSGG
jgi:hypothetical protein